MFPDAYFAPRYFAPRYFPRPSGAAPVSSGNYVQRLVGRTTRASDFTRRKVVDVDALRRKREEEEIIIL